MFEAFLEKHCVRCHGADQAERDLRIDQLSRDFIAGADGHLWAEIVERINSGEMPPEDEPQPAIEEKLGQKLDCTHPAETLLEEPPAFSRPSRFREKGGRPERGGGQRRRR